MSKFKSFVFIPTSEYALIDINESDKKVILYTSSTPHLLPFTATKQSFVEYSNKVYEGYEFDFNFKDLELIEVTLTINNKENA